jgi:hypothetical protein
LRCSRCTYSRFIGAAGLSSAGIPFIDLSIFIVINTVADFLLRRCVRDTHDPAALALCRTLGIRAGSAGIASDSPAGIPFIDLPVTVIIPTITDLDLVFDHPLVDPIPDCIQKIPKPAVPE